MRRLAPKLFIGILTILTASRLFVSPVFAQPVEWNAQGLNCTGANSGIAGANDVATIQGLGCLIANVLSVAITMIGMLAFVMFVVASFRYLLAGGNSKNVELAKGTITYAVAGIVVAISAFIILNLISQFTGINVSRFILPEATTSP